MKKKKSLHIKSLHFLVFGLIFLMSYPAFANPPVNEKPSLTPPIQTLIEKRQEEKAKPESKLEEKSKEEKGKPEEKPIALQAQPKGQPQRKEKKSEAPPPDLLKREIPVSFPGDKEDNLESLKNYKPRTQIVKDEGFHMIEISLKDVSRLVCFAEIEKVIYSKEKGIEVKTSGRNAYIKNLPKESVNPITGKLMVEYDSRPKELYVICADKTFSLVLIPQDIPAVTAYLQSSHADTMKAFTHEKTSTYEDTILNLIKSAYFEEVPPGYEVEEINKPVKEFQEVQIVHSKNYIGAMYQIHEYILIARTELTLNEMTILETLKPANPLAVSIVYLYLRPGDQTRAFVVSSRR